MTETRDDLGSRRWYGDLLGRPALASADAVARTRVSIDADLVDEYRDRVSFNRGDVGDALVAGVIASATCSHNGYRVVEVLEILEEANDAGERERLLVGVIITSGGIK